MTNANGGAGHWSRIVLLALLGLVSAVGISASACRGGAPAEVRRVELKQLLRSPSGYEGQIVQTSGVVHDIESGAPEHRFVVASKDGQYSVSLLASSEDLLQQLVGSVVDVTGRFEALGSVGGSIEVQSIGLLHTSRSQSSRLHAQSAHAL